MISDSTKIAAHRGGAQIWPENSRLAFQNAVRLDVDFIEFDVHRTKDGVLVVHHDAVLGRTCEGSGAIAGHDWSDLKHLRLHRTEGETLPTLLEILGILQPGSPALRLEIKYMADGCRYPGLERQVLEVLRERGLLNRTTITAFDIEVLREIAQLAPDMPSIHLIRESEYIGAGRNIAVRAKRALEAGIHEIAIRVEQLENDDVEICRAHGVALGVFAAHDIPSIEQAFDRRVSAFTTDRPDLALEVRNRRT